MMPWDRESNEEYDDGFTRESFERADEDDGDDGGTPREERFVLLRVWGDGRDECDDYEDALNREDMFRMLGAELDLDPGAVEWLLTKKGKKA